MYHMLRIMTWHIILEDMLYLNAEPSCISLWNNVWTQKISTEAEIVGTSNYDTSTIYARLFLEAQGYNMQPDILHQDNESAIKLEKHGRISSIQKIRHIDIRYYFLKDRIKKRRVYS